MKFEELCDRRQDRRLTQEQAAQLPGVCGRTFRRYIDRYEDDGLDGLTDKRINEVSSRKAPVDEVPLAARDKDRKIRPKWGRRSPQIFAAQTP